MPSNSIYREHGYTDRDDYLESLADEYGVDLLYVVALAELLGEVEDFDGLPTTLADAV